VDSCDKGPKTGKEALEESWIPGIPGFSTEIVADCGLDPFQAGAYTLQRWLSSWPSTKNPKHLMTKRDLVIRISNETGLVQQQVLDVIQKTLDYISAALAQGKKVELRNFGVFEVKVRKARVGRNPNAPETDVPIPQRAVVKFKPGKEMRETVIQLTPEQVEAAAREQAAEAEAAESKDEGQA
jgi:nucleoid DNA-binding protein